MHRTSLFGEVTPYAGDPILSLFEAFKADPRPQKVNLGIGVYRDEEGRIPVLGSVLAARERLGFGPRPYLQMEGHEGYRQGVQRLVFGADHPALQESRVATIQTIGGTGAVGIAADFLAKHCHGRMVYVSDPTWENHHGLFQRAGFATTTYPYWDPATRSIPFERLLATLEAAAPSSIVVIQPVCHNPTGIDLSLAQEAALTALIQEKRHIVLFDMAYQGFGEGLDEDAGFVRRYASKSACLIANSFSKNVSLYGERCGALSVVCETNDEADRVLGQLKLAGMRDRMKKMRADLAGAIAAASNAADSSFLIEQRGMFSYTGLSAGQVRKLRERDAIYLVESGRLCVAGLTVGSFDRVAHALADIWSHQR